MTKVSILKTEGKLSHAIHIEADKENGVFNIPVIDVRDDIGTGKNTARESAAKVEKYANIAKGSKYFKPTFSGWGYSYNNSMKGIRP